MKVTVAICTRNRSRLLQQTLSSFRQLKIPASVDWELLVVDNRSEDQTPEIVQSFAKSLPLQYLFEPVTGHSRSRNRAIAHASGDLILWTDDDVRIPPNWLAIYAAAAERFPDAAFFGSKIVPKFEQPPPQWLMDSWDKCHPAFATRDLGNHCFQLQPGQYPFGANFAVRGDLQRTFLFDVKLGRNDQIVIGDDEINLMQRLTAAGHRGIWLPDAPVEHVIPPERATIDYLSRYFAGQGIANVLKDQATMPSMAKAYLIYLHNRWCYRLKRYWTDPDEWVSHLIRSSIAMGESQGWAHRKSPCYRNSKQTQVALVTDVPFWRQQTGAQQRIAGLVRHLQRQQFQIDTLYLGHREEQATDVFSLIDDWKPTGWIEWLRWQRVCIAHAVARFMRVGQKRQPSEVDSAATTRRLKDFQSPELQHRFQNWVAQHRPDVVIVEYATLSYLIPDRPRPHKPFYIVDTHDVLSARCQQFKQQGLPHWIDIEFEQERKCLQKFDAIIAIQPDEAQAFSEMLDDVCILVAGHALEPEWLAQKDWLVGSNQPTGQHLPDRNASDNSEVRIGILASENGANQVGLTWFLQNVWPLVKEGCKRKIKFVVAGGIDKNHFRMVESSGVTWMGSVDQVDDFYRQIDIVVNPTQFGTGLKIKNIEALAFGKPLVMTAHAASGLFETKMVKHDDPYQNSKFFEMKSEATKEFDLEPSIQFDFPLSIDSPQKMAEILIRLVEDSEYRKHMGECGIQFTRKHLTPDRVYGMLTDYLKTISEKRLR